MQHITIIGAPVQTGTSQPGCIMGPDALRTAGLNDALKRLGHQVMDLGNLQPTADSTPPHPNHNIRKLDETVGWARTLAGAAYNAMDDGKIPIFLGGDHSLSIGTVPGVTRRAADHGRPQFVLWLDAHPDMHTLKTTGSGNLHGTPVAYFSGLDGFGENYPPLTNAVPAENICMMGIRSVDEAEKAFLSQSKVIVHDMRILDEHGFAGPLRDFLQNVEAANGALHLSLDVDFLEPEIAPAVGTTVPGGATFREAHLVMEMLYDSALVTSLDLVELNPFLDERGRTAKLMVDLCASLFGRKVYSTRPTNKYPNSNNCVNQDQ